MRMINPETNVEPYFDSLYTSLSKDQHDYFCKYVPSHKVHSVPNIGVDTVYHMFQNGFFESCELFYGCIYFMEGRDNALVMTIPALQYISQKNVLNDLWTMYYAVKKQTGSIDVNSRILRTINRDRVYSPIVVQNWKTDTYLCIGFELNSSNKVEIIFSYVNQDLEVCYGNWRAPAIKFLDYLETFYPRFIARVAETFNYCHYI